MKQKLKNTIISLTLALTGTMVIMPATASADTFKEGACGGVNTLNDTSGSVCDANADKKLNSVIRAVIQVLSVVVGFAAVIMIIIGGIKFITAGGDSGSIASARNTIMYALIGLIIVAIAQVLVHFVITKVK